MHWRKKKLHLFVVTLKMLLNFAHWYFHLRNPPASFPGRYAQNWWLKVTLRELLSVSRRLLFTTFTNLWNNFYKSMKSFKFPFVVHLWCGIDHIPWWKASSLLTNLAWGPVHYTSQIGLQKWTTKRCMMWK